MLNRRFCGALQWRALRAGTALVRAVVVMLGIAAAGGANAETLEEQAARQVVVHLTSENERQQMLNALYAANIAVEAIEQIPGRPVYLLTIEVTSTAQEAVNVLNECSAVEFAELNYLVNSDPWLYEPGSEAKLNSVLAIGDGMTCIADNGRQDCEPEAVNDLLRLASAHKMSTGTGVRVAVLDTGIDPDHPGFGGMELRAQRDFIDNDDDVTEGGTEITDIAQYGPFSVGHGTHVSGIVRRVAPNAELMVGRVLDPTGTGTTWLTAKGIFWAIDPHGNGHYDSGAHVINLSLDTRTDTQVLRLASNVATCKALPDNNVWARDYRRCTVEKLRAVIVAAVGNDASGDARLYPAAYSYFIPGMLAVAASDNRPTLVRAPAFFTNSGTYVDVAAPGYGIRSQFYDDSLAWISGTSMAAPMVSGLAALVRSVGGKPNNWSPQAVVDRIRTRGVKMCGTPMTFTHVDVAATVVDGAAPLGPCP
jgi:subtilisin family serine protease